MTKEELNMALFDKMTEEMEKYVAHLQTLSPEEILNHCQEYVTKFDILSIMDAADLPAEQARALLAVDSPLDAVYLHYDTKEVNHLDSIRDAIEEKATTLITEFQSVADIPVYPFSFAQAESSGMTDGYIMSYRLNVRCKEDIESAIKDFYRNNSLNAEAARRVTEKYGIPRTVFVLVNTLQHKNWDGRFSQQNRSWAEAQAMLPDKDATGYDRRLAYVVQSHSGLTDLFVTCIRDIAILQKHEKKAVQKVRPSIRERIRESSPQNNSPNYSANKKEPER